MATTKELAEARRLREDGWTLEAIAQELGYSRKTISGWLDPAIAERQRANNRNWKRKHRRRERERRRRERRENRQPCPECGRLMGRGSGGRRCQKCVDEERAFKTRDLQVRWNRGDTVHDIAEAMGTTPGTVYSLVARARKTGWTMTHRHAPRAPAYDPLDPGRPAR